MSLVEMQSYLARLYTDDGLRKLFTLAPEAPFESYLSPEDAFTTINTQGLPELMPLLMETVPILLPGVYRETFMYPIVSLIDALSEQQPVDVHTLSPGRYDLVFQRETHSLTMNVFALNAETSLLLDLCQQEHTIATVIQMVEQQLEKTNLADDILTTLRILQEKKIIGVCHESL
jgi:hypothetical protein